MNNPKLKNMVKLSSKITFYVPATHGVDKQASNTEEVKKVAAKFSELFGGATSTKAIGYWQSMEKGLVRENTTLVFSYCTDVQLENGVDDVITLAEQIKTEMQQENVAIEINGELYFI